ncbi:hypothetical protein [Lutibacter sp.]|uniref:hypothetical protein n=1 Tax=Lutibacter sp. TaxID=1925666 RepID=UPI001A2EE421|nr:hypothetical protein [Lutibacter sp.]MBI9040596.1 hypothetical protein [Lutibacter sp.]
MNCIKQNNFGKWLIFSIGFLFTIYGLFLGSLTLFGTETKAKITSYRQEYGERNETIRNQYTYLFGYEFEYKGKVYTGTGQQIGSPVFLKNNGNSFITVKFLPAIPQLNSSFNGEKTIWNIAISFVIGIGLMYITKKME